MAKKSTQEDGALDLALSRLREMIVAGALLPGEQIRQQEVADELGVSRVPLREALNVLASQGLLTHRPHQGYFVAKRLPMELAQLRRMMQLLEGELIMSMAFPDDDVLSELEDLNAQMLVHAARTEWMGLLALNRKFHFRIFELSPYNLILDQVTRLWDLAEPFIANKLALKDARLRTCEEHALLIDALRRKDRSAALDLWHVHRSSTVSGLPYDLPADSASPAETLAH